MQIPDPDRALQARVQQLQAGDDETGDGKVDIADLKRQLDRIEAQLELQDAQNRRLLRSQRQRLILNIVVLAAFAVLAGVLLYYSRIAYDRQRAGRHPAAEPRHAGQRRARRDDADAARPGRSAFSDRCGRAERGAAEAARRDGFGRSPANPNRADFRLAIKPWQLVRGNGVRGRPPFCRAFPQFPKIMTPPLFLGIISLFIAASSIVHSQK